MPSFPNTTISNLSGVTGVPSNSLRDHDPRSSPGSDPTSIGDFVLEHIGRFDSSNGWVTDLERAGGNTLFPEDPNYTVPASGEPDGTEMTAIVEMRGDRNIGGGTYRSEGGRLFPIAASQYSGGLTDVVSQDLSELSRSYSGNTNTIKEVRITYQVDGFNPNLDLRLQDGFNTHVPEYDTDLSLNPSDIISPNDVPLMYLVNIDSNSDGSGGFNFTANWTPYDPEDSISNISYKWELAPNSLSPNASGTTTSQSTTFNNDNVNSGDVEDFVVRLFDGSTQIASLTVSHTIGGDDSKTNNTLS